MNHRRIIRQCLGAIAALVAATVLDYLGLTLAMVLAWAIAAWLVVQILQSGAIG